MADVLGLLFRRFAPAGSDATAAEGLEGNSVLLADRDVSTRVLFLAAVTAAADLQLRVLLFTHAPVQPVSLPASQLTLQPLQNVRFVYGGSLEEFLEDVSSLHQLISPPSLILVDDLKRFLQPPRDELSSAARAAALLHDTAAFLTRIPQSRAENRRPCRVIVSIPPDRDGDPQAADLLLAVLQRYLPVRCGVEAGPGEAGAGQGAWRVSVGPAVRSGAAVEFGDALERCCGVSSSH